mgnify:CR=1 FL=1
MTDTAPATASRGTRVPLAGMALPVVSAKTVAINDGGVASTVRLAAPNVGALLAAAGVPLLQEDTVVPAASSPVTPGMQIQVTRVRVNKVTERQPLIPNAQRIEDPTMNISRQVVQDPGTPGTQDVTFAVATINGVETGRRTFEPFLREVGWSRGDIDKTICHQVGVAHRKLLFETLGLDESLDYSTFETLGNTGAAALPLTVLTSPLCASSRSGCALGHEIGRAHV